MKHLIRSLLAFVIFSSFFSGCSTRAPVHEMKAYVSFIQTYPCSKEELWKATVETLQDHTIVIANRDQGLLKTEWEGFFVNSANEQARTLASSDEGHRYKSQLKLLVVESSHNPNQSDLFIDKDLYFYNKTVGAMERIPSDGLEEDFLFKQVYDRLKEQKK